MNIREFETNIYNSFHRLSDFHPIQSRLMAPWPCAVSLFCCTCECMYGMIHPKIPHNDQNSLIGKISSVAINELTNFEIMCLAFLFTPFRWVAATINPKNISPLWSFPYPCHCPSCNPNVSDSLEGNIKPIHQNS